MTTNNIYAEPVPQYAAESGMTSSGSKTMKYVMIALAIFIGGPILLGGGIIALLVIVAMVGASANQEFTDLADQRDITPAIATEQDMTGTQTLTPASLTSDKNYDPFDL